MSILNDVDPLHNSTAFQLDFCRRIEFYIYLFKIWLNLFQNSKKVKRKWKKQVRSSSMFFVLFKSNQFPVKGDLIHLVLKGKIFRVFLRVKLIAEIIISQYLLENSDEIVAKFHQYVPRLKKFSQNFTRKRTKHCCQNLTISFKIISTYFLETFRMSRSCQDFLEMFQETLAKQDCGNKFHF